MVAFSQALSICKSNFSCSSICSSQWVAYGCLETISGLPWDALMPSLTWVLKRQEFSTGCKDGVLARECAGSKKETK